MQLGVPIIVLLFGIHCCMGMNVLLHLGRKRSTRVLTNTHSFIDEVCAPDNILSRITGVHALIRYTLDPTVIESVSSYTDTSYNRIVYYNVEKGSHTHIVPWIQLVDKTYHMKGHNHVLVNNTFKKVPARDIECVEFRYFGFIGDPNVVTVRILYDIEVWWFQDKIV